jgi:hypothetical protein
VIVWAGEAVTDTWWASLKQRWIDWREPELGLEDFYRRLRRLWVR